MRKFFCDIAVIILACSSLFCQKLEVYNINTQNFPKMSAKFVLSDNNGNYIRLNTLNDIQIFEDGIQRTVTNLTCPPDRSPQPISLAISLDVSGSMDEKDGAKKRVVLGVETITNLINSVIGNSEFAIQTCTDRPQILTDFTTNKDMAINFIKRDTAYGNNDFVTQLLDPYAGLLNIAAFGKHKRVAIIYTDAFWKDMDPINLQNCIDLCAKYNILFIAIIYSKKDAEPNGIINSLTQIANTSGGFTIVGVVDEVMAKSIISKIQPFIQSGDPCTVEWLSDGCSNNRLLEVKCPQYSVIDTKTISIPLDLFPQFTYPNGSFLLFKDVAPGTSQTMVLPVKATNKDIKVDSIVTSNQNFVITDYGGSPPPFIVPINQTRNFIVKFTPPDSNYDFSTFTIYNNSCLNSTFSAKGGYPMKPPSKKTLKIIQPNGGEIIAAGSQYPVTWEGIPKEEQVVLDLSIDSGKTWSNITRAATNLNYNWQVNKVESNRCLIKATESYIPNDESYILSQHTLYVRCVAWSPNGKYLASGGADSAMIIWDAKTLKPLLTLNNSKMGLGVINFICWSPDSKTIAVTGNSSSVCLIDMSLFPTSYSLNLFYPNEFAVINKAAFSPNGKYLATGSSMGHLKIWTLNPVTLVKDISQGYSGPEILNFAWNANSNQIVTCEEKEIGLYDINNGLLKASYSNMWLFRAIDWSQDNRIIIFGDDDGNLYGFYPESNSEIKLGNFFNHSIKSISISPDGSMAAICSDTVIVLLDLNDFSVIAQLKGHTRYVNSVDFYPSGSVLASGSDDFTVRIWNTGYSLQNDISDSLFTIVKPHAAAYDIDMGSSIIGVAKDSVIDVFTTNTGSLPIAIDSIYFSGIQAKDFNLVSGLPHYEIPVSGHNFAEIVFTPSSIGVESADIIIITQSDTIKQKITGTGIKPELLAITKMLDFGKVYVNHHKIISDEDVITNQTNSNILIDSTLLTGPDIEQFSVVNGGGSFSILSNANHKISAMFAPTKVGRTNGSVSFYYTGVGSPAVVRMYGEGIETCDSSNFTQQDFSDYSDFNLIESATVNSGFVRLTSAANNLRGAIWYKNLLPLGKDFTTDFQMRLSGGWNDNQIEHSSPGADGFAFVIQYYNPFAIGNNGGGIGYDGIPNSLAIEFDTYCNDSLQIENFNDPNGNHIAVQTLGIQPNSAIHGSPQTLSVNQNIVPLIADSSKTYYVRIVYTKENKSLLVFIDTTGDFTTPFITLDSFELSKLLNLNDSINAYAGITSSTGSSYERHDLLSWTMCTSTQSLINSVEDYSNMPFNSELFSITPNPFEQTTSIKFRLHNNSFITLKVLNILGQEVACLLNNKLEAGFKDIEFSPKGIKSGIYMCELTIDGQTYIKKIIYIE